MSRRENYIELKQKQILMYCKIFAASLLMFFPIFGKAQNCCVQDKGWIAMASATKFETAHEAPLPFEYAPDHGKMIDFETDEGKKGYAFYVPSDKPTNNVLLIFPEWWGVNDYIKQEAERWQKMLGNVDVYAIDLYDGKVAATPEEAKNLSISLDAKRGESIVNGVLSLAGTDKNIATLGWCMGGSWSFTAALLAGQQARACVMYYGFPEQDSAKISQLKCDVLYNRGAKDAFITKDKMDTFQKNVETAQHRLILHSFNADHAFANPSNPKHDPVATEQANSFALKFLKEKLQL